MARTVLADKRFHAKLKRFCKNDADDYEMVYSTVVTILSSWPRSGREHKGVWIHSVQLPSQSQGVFIYYVFDDEHVALLDVEIPAM